LQRFLSKEAALSFETLVVIYQQTMRCYNPEDLNVNFHRHENSDLIHWSLDLAVSNSTRSILLSWNRISERTFQKRYVQTRKTCKPRTTDAM